MSIWTSPVAALAKLPEPELIKMKRRLEKERTYAAVQVQQLNEALERKASSQHAASVDRATPTPSGASGEGNDPVTEAA